MRSLPKVELHLHLDCSLSYSVVSRLAPHVTRSEYDRAYRAPMKCADLAEFLACARMGYGLMQTEEALRLVTEDVFGQLAKDNLIYAEIRFAPLLHLENGLAAERVVEIVERATDEMSRQTGIEARLILCTLRHYTQEQSITTVKLVEAFRGSRVAALDIAGDEAGYPLDAHIPAFLYAQERGLHRTAHAGEARGPQSVWETLDRLKPTRIGHGARSAEDPKLLARLRHESIHLELCPSSNVQTNVVEGWKDHPLDGLYRGGVPVSVSTDSRMLNPTTLTREYEQVAHYFGWTENDFLQTNLAAIRAAFLDDSLKRTLESKLRAAHCNPAAVETSELA